MNATPVFAALSELFREVFDDDALVLTPASSAADIAGWDSLNHISLLVAAEMRFGVKFRGAEMEDLQNVGELAALITRLLADKG